MPSKSKSLPLMLPDREPENADWIGRDPAYAKLKTKRKPKRKPTANAFCPTGEGGGVDPTCSPKGSGTAVPKAKVVMDHEQRKNIKKHFGFSDDDIAGLVGAQPGSTVTIKGVNIAGSNYGMTYISVHTKHEKYESRRTIVKNPYGQGDTIINDSIEVYETGKGLGTKIFSEQVDYAVKKGFHAIETTAIRGIANGYYTWARLGYDGKIPWSHEGRFVKQEAQQIVPNATRVSDLMKTPEGREWWKKNGVGFEAEFSLSEGSQSRKVLDAYRKAKMTSNIRKAGANFVVQPVTDWKEIPSKDMP